jgi:2-dehydropantoate 2-reductase
MRVCIVGAGAIGCFVGARLARQGVDVTLVARGGLRALQERGLTLVERDGTEVTQRLRAIGSAADAGPQDVVILAAKAHQVPPLVPSVAALLGRGTTFVTMQNGIPWWYFQRFDGPLAGRTVESVDAGGAIAAAIDPERILGCVVYPACEMAAPGVVRHVEGERFPLGELDGAASPRAQEISALFESAGLRAPVLTDIRSEIWLKLWGNLSFNPISGLSHATLADICGFPLSRELAANMMREAQEVAQRLGIQMRVPLEKRIAGAEKVGHHKTSMLQDIEAGRSPEIDALVGSVVELARMAATPTPHIDTVYALVKLLAQSMARQRGALRLEATA